MRTLLFAPGNNEHKLTAAFDAGADAVIADLDVSVPPDQKAEAREIVTRVFSTVESSSAKLVRINRWGSPFLEDDLASTQDLALDALMIPRAIVAAMVDCASAGRPLLPTLETADAVLACAEIAAAPGVTALIFGAVALRAQLGLIARADELELLAARSQAILASAAAGIEPPIDAAHLDHRDEVGLRSAAAHVRSLGFQGKLCIHPAQVPVVNDIFD